jgi:hypothetical protein
MVVIVMPVNWCSNPPLAYNSISVEIETLIQFLIQNINDFFVQILKKKRKDRKFFCFVQF